MPDRPAVPLNPSEDDYTDPLVPRREALARLDGAR